MKDLSQSLARDKHAAPEHATMGAVMFLVMVAFLGTGLWWLYSQQKRREGLLDLAKKYNLEVNPERRIAPEPEIRGLVFWARYKRYLQGHIRDVPVVAFDYEIGWGRGHRYGSGVGVQRNVLDVPLPSRDLVLTHEDGWSFLYTRSVWMAGRTLDAEDIERLWDLLLTSPSDGPERSIPAVDVPGGIVIRPRKPQHIEDAGLQIKLELGAVA